MNRVGCIGLIVGLFLCLGVMTKAQVIRVDGGMAFSKLSTYKSPFGDVLNKFITPFQMSVGIEYMDKNSFYLSSSIGYLRKGGKDDLTENNSEIGAKPTKGTVKYLMDYLTVNTLFNIKKEVRREIYYVGIGPRVDFKVKDKSKLKLQSEIENLNNHAPIPGTQSVVLGLKCDAGFWYRLDDHFRLGAHISYLPSFTKTWSSPVEGVEMYQKDRTFTLGIALGYAL